MKKGVNKKITAIILAAAMLVSVASCSSSGGKNDDDRTKPDETTAEAKTSAGDSEETVAESIEETTTTAEETTEETTTATTTEETTTIIDDPDVAMYYDPDVRAWAKWYLDQGYYVEYMSYEDSEGFWGKGTNCIEGFAAGTDDDNLLTLDYVMKFKDRESAEAFITTLEENGWDPIESYPQGDGSCNYSIAGGIWSATLSSTDVLRIVFEGE